MICRFFISVSVLLVTTAAMPDARRLHADVVTGWNEIASQVLIDNVDLQNPGMSSRTMAMMNLAIHDSLAMTGSFGTTGSVGQTFYQYNGISAATTASGTAAAASAAYTVLRSIYPDQQTSLEAKYSTAIAGIASGTARDSGIALGQSIGQSIVSRRANDGYNTMSQYQPTNLPGRWQPDPLNPSQEAWGPNWGNVQTFRIASVAPFLPSAPPPLSSQQYATSFNEVKELGAIDSATRTQEQTDIGKFWAYDRVGMGTPIRLYNQALRNIADIKNNTTEDNAKLFAKASVAMADAGIVAWNAKFEHDLWRPVTGIRQADTDGNPDTIADPNWTPLGAPELNDPDFTPPFPTYISGHATFGGALFASIENFYGTDSITFGLSSDELDGEIRMFDSLSEAMAENGRSRVYLGIHWDYDDTEGQLVGIDVANFISSSAFVTAVPEPGSFAFGVAAVAWWMRRRRPA